MTFTLREQEWRMDVHSRREDHRKAHKVARNARDAHLLLLGNEEGWPVQVEQKREANRLYTNVYLQVRRELKQKRSTPK